MRTKTIHDIQGAVEPLDTGLERVANDERKTFSSMFSFKLLITTTPYVLPLVLMSFCANLFHSTTYVVICSSYQGEVYILDLI